MSVNLIYSYDLICEVKQHGLCIHVISQEHAFITKQVQNHGTVSDFKEALKQALNRMT